MKIMGSNDPLPKAEVGDWKTRRERATYLIKEMAIPVPGNIKSKDYETTGFDGNKILLGWYEKEGTAKGGPAILYFHGGGYISGTVPLCWRPKLSIQATSDAYAVLVWLHDRASELGVDAQRLAVMEESAGGGLAAALTHYNLEKKGPALAKQILMYPMLDDRNVGAHPNIGEFTIWTPDDNKTGWGCILGNKAGAADLPLSAAPSRMKSAEGLPQLYLNVGGVDIFRDEGVEYAVQFGKVGIECELHLYPGCPHGFEGLAPESAVSKAAMANRNRAILSIDKVGDSKLV
ncbi:gb [Venturia nashicola]|uniref:Gb n=1 Tax=Venturia nashicola TaxID=86259 RepID=A0A4Z1NKI5_9PEZI|nr:gb [Venturia nashicola]